VNETFMALHTRHFAVWSHGWRIISPHIGRDRSLCEK